MRHHDGVYTQQFDRRECTDGPPFRGRYRSVLIGEDSHLGAVSRYIHLNPVDARIVAEPEDFTISVVRRVRERIDERQRRPWSTRP